MKHFENQKGFGAVWALVIILVLLIIGAWVIALDRTQRFNAATAAAKSDWSSNDGQGTVLEAQQAMSYASSNSQKAVAYYWLGLGADMTHQTAAAKADEEHAVQLGPSYAAPYVTLGAIAFHQGDNATALKDANRSISLDPNYPWSYNLKALAEDAEGQKVQAVADEEKAVQLDSTESEFKQNLASFQNK